MKYMGVIIEESLIDNRYINEFQISKAKVSNNPIPSERLHMYEVIIDYEEIVRLSKYMVEGWYMHFWAGNSVVAIYKNKVFQFKYNDKNTWKEIWNHAYSIGLPINELKFSLKGL